MAREDLLLSRLRDKGSLILTDEQDLGGCTNEPNKTRYFAIQTRTRTQDRGDAGLLPATDSDQDMVIGSPKGVEWILIAGLGFPAPAQFCPEGLIVIVSWDADQLEFVIRTTNANRIAILPGA